MNIFSKIFAKSKINDSDNASLAPAPSFSDASQSQPSEQPRQPLPSAQNSADIKAKAADLSFNNFANLAFSSNLAQELNSLANINYRPHFDNLEQFKIDFKQIKAELIIIEKIAKAKPTFNQNTDFEALYQSFTTFCRKNEGFIEQIEQLLAAEAALSSEIVKYSDIVAEMAAKYKLSPDWGGKKPQMINLGQQLNQKRSALLDQEEALKAKAGNIYGQMQEYHDLFCQNAQSLKEFIQT